MSPTLCCFYGDVVPWLFASVLLRSLQEHVATGDVSGNHMARDSNDQHLAPF